MQVQPSEKSAAAGAEAGPSSEAHPEASSQAGPSSFAAAAANGHPYEDDGEMGPRSMSTESMRSAFLGLAPPDRLDSLLTQSSVTSKDALTHAIAPTKTLGSLPSNPSANAVPSRA